MNPDLAEELLRHVMDWRTDQIGENYRKLRALGISGYDDYVQFRPGRRFIESMAQWLVQFDTEHRQAAYDFVINRVLFITHAQMRQAVCVTYSHHVLPMLTDQIAEESGGKFMPWQVSSIRRSDEFKALRNKCLFLGMSDGSHVDEFRRSDQSIDHEQVLRTHEISPERASKLQAALADRLQSAGKPKFRNVFLLDDFSASGTSYWVEGPEGIKGKIGSFYQSINDDRSPISGLVDLEDLRVCAILYVASETAKTALEACRTKFAKIAFKAVPIQLIPSRIEFNSEKDSDFAKLVHHPKFKPQDLMDTHMKQGNTTNPHLGFADCALPLILYHNTPNNSIPILHNTSESYYKGLFPRIRRHQ